MKKLIHRFSNFLDINFTEKDILSHSQDELTRIKIVNYICVISIVNMLLYVGIYCVLDFQLFFPVIIFLLFCSVITTGIIIFNKKGFYNTSKILVGVLTPLYMTTVTTFFFNKEPGFHVYLLLGTIIPVFIWSFKQKGYLIFFITINLILYILIEVQPTFIEPLISIPSKYAISFRHSNMIVCFVAVGAAIGFYQWFINEKEKQLIEQEKELRLSQKHKDIVYSIIAHDLKGPIGSFVGLTDFFLSQSEDFDEERLKTIIGRMNETSSSLHKLLENLLDWSKMQSGNIEQSKTDFYLGKTVSESIGIYHELSNEKEQSIEVEIDSNIRVNANEYMILTVIRNLISNAIKFTPNKGKIVVSAVTKNDEVKICVSDSGIGIAEAEIENLFDIRKMSSSLKTSYNGSGLGLLICKDFVESNQGKLWVESELGKGSRFYFTINIASNNS